MVSFLPLLLLRPFSPYTLTMPRPLTALSLGQESANGWVPLVAGDGDGVLYEPRAGDPHPIGRVAGRVTTLRHLGSNEFVVAYAPNQGGQKVELWRTEGGMANSIASLETFPNGSEPVIAIGPQGIAVGWIGGSQISLFDPQGHPQGTLSMNLQGLVGLAGRRTGGRAASFFAAFAGGRLVEFGPQGEIVRTSKLPTTGRVLAFAGDIANDRVAWASDERGGLVGVLDFSGAGRRPPIYPAPGVAAVRVLWSGLPLIVGERTVDVHRHAAPWRFEDKVVAADAASVQVVVALSDGTLIVRTPLKAWIRKGDAALIGTTERP